MISHEKANVRESAWAKAALVTCLIAAGGLLFFFTKPPGVISGTAAKAPSIPAAPLPPGEAATEASIHFYTERVKRDPEDCRSQNALAELYLQRVHETGVEDYLTLARAAAQASLAAVGAERNLGGLSALAHAEYSNHDFAGARDHALQLCLLDPAKSESFALLGDAQSELGDYAGASEAFSRMEQLGKNNSGTETRLAHFAFLHGNPEAARQHLEKALALLRDLSAPPAETVAWCRWQLGEIAFSTGDYKSAEHHFRDALVTSPGYFRALGSMGALRAAQGLLPDAISFYEQAIRAVAAPAYVAALGDLYALTGRQSEAAIRYELVGQLGEHAQRIHGQPFNRQLALFLADHDLKTEEAYALASEEYAVRRDIHGADALAWTALKSGRVPEAQAAMQQALRLGTRDAKIFYHAGMIARAAGDKAAGTDFLRRALQLNPGFDPLQSKAAQKALTE